MSSKSIQDSVQPLFPLNSPAVANLLRLLDRGYAEYAPLNLKACVTTQSRVLAFAPHYVPAPDAAEVWNDKYSAVTFPGDSTGPPPVLFVRALLVGVVGASNQGALHISTKLFPTGVQAVIAPPPGPALCGTPVWIRDWRYIPFRLWSRTSGGEGLFEVLKKDVVPLLPRALDVERAWVRMRPGMYADPKKRFNVRGCVHAKSCLIAHRRSSVCFFVELTETAYDCTRAAATVVFRGPHVVKWWAFLSVGQHVGITSLTISKLPSYDNQIVFRASGTSVSVQELMNGEAILPFKRQFSESQLAEPQESSRNCLRRQNTLHIPSGERVGDVQRCFIRAHVITFEGELTRVLADGRFELDGRVVLHLGGINGSCAGPGVSSVCFRNGTRVEAQWVVAFSQPDHRVTLFPTGRTVVSVLYFGSLDRLECFNGFLRWEDTPWQWLWKRWKYMNVLWAEDLFDSLILKFKPWLLDSEEKEAPGSTCKDGRKLVHYLLGAEGQAGLVQVIMHTIGNREEVMQSSNAPRRNIYRQFLNPLEVAEAECDKCFPKALSMKDVSEHVDMLWNDAASARLIKYESLGHVPSTSLTVMVGKSQLDTACLPQMSKRKCQSQRTGPGIAIICLLQGSCKGDGRLVLSDASGSLEARTIGPLPPFMVGAIVCVTDFSIVIESTGGFSSRIVTLLFNPHNAHVVVDGPCVEMNRREAKLVTSSTEERNARRERLPNHENFTQRLTQKATAGICASVAERLDDSGQLIVDSPLVCLFVCKTIEQGGLVKLEGRLIAVATSRHDNEWQALSLPQTGFLRCSLKLSGESALQLCPVFQENMLLGISCTELHAVPDPALYVLNKAERSAYKRQGLELSSCLSSQFPWIENLGRGYYMRFKVNGVRSKNPDEAFKRCSTSLVSDEGTQYNHVTEAIENFLSEATSSVQRMLWKVYQWKEKSERQESQVLSIRGIVRGIATSFEETTGPQDTPVTRLEIHDEVLHSFTVTVHFYCMEAKPKGIAPGMSVVIYHVVRMPSRTSERFLFEGTKDTVVRVLAVPTAGDLQVSCRKCQPVLSLKSASNVLPRKYLWDFSRPSEIRAEECCASGVVRFWVLHVKWLKLSIADEDLNCTGCSIEDEFGVIWSIDVSTLIVVDDGSTEAEMRCYGFENCARLLNASDYERKAIKSVALAFRSIYIDGNRARASLSSGPAGQRRTKMDICLDAVYRFICRSRGQTSFAVVLNQTCVEENTANKVEVDEIDVSSYHMGFGQRLWTCRSPCLKVAVRCVALCGACLCSKKQCIGCEDMGLITPLRALRYLMKVEEGEGQAIEHRGSS